MVFDRLRVSAIISAYKPHTRIRQAIRPILKLHNNRPESPITRATIPVHRTQNGIMVNPCKAVSASKLIMNQASPHFGLAPGAASIPGVRKRQVIF